VSLIEKALNKASRETTSRPSEEGQLQIDPTSIVSPSPRRQKSALILLCAGLLVLMVVTLSIFLYTYHQPLPSKPVSAAAPVTPGRPASSPSEIHPAQPSETLAARPQSSLSAANDKQEKGKPPETSKTASSIPFFAPPENLPIAGGKPAAPASVTHALPQDSQRLPGVTSPQDPTGSLLKKAYAYGEAGKYAQALECYDSILSLNPRHYEALLNRGIMNQKTDSLDGAEKDLLLAAQVNPDDPILLNALGVLYLSRGDEAKAREFLLKAGDPTSLINLSLLYWEKAQWENVISTLRKAKEQDAQNPYAPYYLGLVYLQVGNTAAASDELEKAANLARRRGLSDLLQTIESVSPGH
jgi:tetratricopeptide (TPR) repeat protein